MGGISDGRTLLRWSVAPEVSGGPDLDEPIVTDRPDFTEASVTVGRNVFQIESGYTFGHDDEDGVRTRSHSIGELLFRYGVAADWFELRLGLSPVSQSTLDGSGSLSASGVEDLYLGTKFALTPQAGLLPEMAIVPQATVPTARRSSAARKRCPASTVSTAGTSTTSSRPAAAPR